MVELSEEQKVVAPVTEPVPPGDATEPAWNGYPLTVAYRSEFQRSVTPVDAERNLIHAPSLN